MRLQRIVSREVLWTIVCCAFCSSLLQPAEAQTPQYATSGAWFKPLLEVDDDARLCADVLAAATREFFGPDMVWPKIGSTDFSPRLELVDFDSFAEPRPAADANADTQGRALAQRPTHVVTVEGSVVYLVRTANPGCGGACDANVYHASTRPMTGVTADSAAYRNAGALQVDVPEYAHAWFKTADGRYYIGYREFRFHRDDRVLFRLAADGSWRETCRASSTPGALDRIDNARVREALSAVHALDDAALAVAGDEGGACGTLHSLGRLNFYRRQFLERALYRPWARVGLAGQIEPLAEASRAKLELWAANGLFEHAALERYRAERGVALAALTKFYEKQFGWAPADAAGAARSVALDVDADFAFPSDDEPYPRNVEARALRRAILEHRPLEDIRALDAPLPAIDGENTDHDESVLNAAVAYPEALRYLLERGANPNRSNDFGKTPLMYAAQQNAYEGARLLLEHGAYPNARTRPPTDECYYALSRTSVTPLHYAVRYASKKLIELLLDKGAAPYILAKPGNFGAGVTDPIAGEYPLHWLARYNSSESAERNPNIARAEVAGLKAALTPLDAAGLSNLARQFTARAEREYSGGNVAAAYSTLRLALDASPDAEGALGDMALVALRAGYPDEAADAARRLVAASTDRRTLANAWFNLGLACDPAVRSTYIPHCDSSPVYPYLQAWSIEPTPARAAKIAEVMERVASCQDTRPWGSTARYLLWGAGSRDGAEQVNKIYAYHPARTAVRADDLHWSAPTGGTISFVRRYDLGDFVVSAFESNQMGTTLMVGDFTCSL